MTKIYKVNHSIEMIRKRPEMYIGEIGQKGLHHLVHELVDNSVDEAMSGFGDEIEVILHNDHSVTVRDNGRGLPVDVHPKLKLSGAEIVMTIPSGSGMGLLIVNALSEELELEIKQDIGLYHLRYSRGNAVGPLELTGVAKTTGLKIRFKPDQEIFPNTHFCHNTLADYLRDIAILHEGLKIYFHDERYGKSQKFHYENGIISFVEHLRKGKNILHTPPIHIRHEQNDLIIELAMQYNDGNSEEVLTFVNHVNTCDGGTHLDGFRSALTRAINDHAVPGGLLNPTESPLVAEDLRKGLVMVLSVKIPDPDFDGLMRGKLINSNVRGLVEQIVYKKLNQIFAETPAIAHSIFKKAVSNEAGHHNPPCSPLKKGRRVLIPFTPSKPAPPQL